VGNTNTVDELRGVFGGAPSAAGTPDQSNVLGVVGFDDDLSSFGEFLEEHNELQPRVLPSCDYMDPFIFFVLSSWRWRQSPKQIRCSLARFACWPKAAPRMVLGH